MRRILVDAEVVDQFAANDINARYRSFYISLIDSLNATAKNDDLNRKTNAAEGNLHDEEAFLIPYSDECSEFYAGLVQRMQAFGDLDRKVIQEVLSHVHDCAAYNIGNFDPPGLWRRRIAVYMRKYKNDDIEKWSHKKMFTHAHLFNGINGIETTRKAFRLYMYEALCDLNSFIERLADQNPAVISWKQHNRKINML